MTITGIIKQHSSVQALGLTFCKATIVCLLLILTTLHPQVGHSQEILVGVHHSPPWSFKNEQGDIVGIEKDIIEKSLTSQGHTVRFQIFGYSRLLNQFSSQQLDFASPFTGPTGAATLTVTYLPFQDVSVSLKSRGLAINAIEDLVGKRVVAYQQAHRVLGKRYDELVASQASYKEFASRENQIELLFFNRADAVVGERRILGYIAHKNHGPDKISTHRIFPETHYPGAAWDKQVVDDFNAGLKRLRESGEYQKILDLYRVK